MFVKVMTSKGRQALIAEILRNRKIIKARNKAEQLQEQDAAFEFEKTFKPLLEPARETQKNTARAAQSSEQTAQVLETLPSDIASRIPIPLAAQIFNQAGLSRIQELGAVKAAAVVPNNWREMLKLPSSLRPADVEARWPKWIYRETSGERQARDNDPGWINFRDEVDAFRESEAVVGEGLRVGGCCKNRTRGERRGGGGGRRKNPTLGSIRYYKDASELMDRLTTLAASVSAGNTSLEIINEASNILDRLYSDNEIDKHTYEQLLRVFV